LASNAFLKSYLDALNSIEGWFNPNAALLFMVYSQLLSSRGISGDVFEIGVHHGKSAIAVASLRGEGRRFFATDLFEDLQTQNVSNSGLGNKEAFLRNMKAFHEDTNFVTTITADSGSLKAEDLGYEFSFCHIDGGHSSQETYQDLNLCSQILLPGGLIALDDYFNPAFPGVCEGAIRFMTEHKGTLIPIAIGYGKVLFQKAPAPFDLNASFVTTYPTILKGTAILWEKPVCLFDSDFLSLFDLAASGPGNVVPKSGPMLRASLKSDTDSLNAERGQTVSLPVLVTNKSLVPFQWGTSSFGLSYHLLTDDGTVLKWDNVRALFVPPLLPGENRIIEMRIQAPDTVGSYQVELDIVWEGVTWLKEVGNETHLVNLVVNKESPTELFV
jgi:hypothetical protein